MASSYVQRVMDGLRAKYSYQPEFLQAVEEVLFSLQPLFAKEAKYEENGILERIVVPERTVEFRVAWTDDKGKVQVNNGYRIQYNSAIGPYKGGIRFHPSVNQGILKFLGFEQIFKNSLTGLPLGGAKGGQTMRAADGYEIMLFPIDEMYITQGEHNGYCIDFVGWSNQTGQIARYPLYAPCNCTCVARSSSGDWQVFNSDNMVHCADGTLRYICFQIGHDNTPQQVGDTFRQGDLIGHTGTNGQVSGDHLHFNTASGHYTAPWSGQLNNSMHIYNICYVNDTTLYRPLSYPWVEYTGPIPPTPGTSKRKKFPWYVITSKKLHRI